MMIVEESGEEIRSIIGTLSRNFSGETDENHER
jgi:hypothetical protein